MLEFLMRPHCEFAILTTVFLPVVFRLKILLAYLTSFLQYDPSLHSLSIVNQSISHGVSTVKGYFKKRRPGEGIQPGPFATVQGSSGDIIFFFYSKGSRQTA